MTEQELKSLFVKAYNLLMLDREQLMDDCLDVKILLTDTTQNDAEIAMLESELTSIAEQVEQMIRTNASREQNQEEYSRCFDAMCGRYDQIKLAYDKAVADRQVKLTQALRLDAFVSFIDKGETVITEWSSDIWNVLVESGTVHRDGSVTFKFKNGKQVRIQ